MIRRPHSLARRQPGLAVFYFWILGVVWLAIPWARLLGWYDLPTRLIHATVRVLEPVSSRAAREAMRERGRSRVVRHLTAELRETFTKGLHSVDVRNA